MEVKFTVLIVAFMALAISDQLIQFMLMAMVTLRVTILWRAVNVEALGKLSPIL